MARPVRYMIALLVLCALLIAHVPAQAAPMTFIRDDEIEATLREFARPVFEQAGLSPSTVRIILIQDASLNAFVAGGQNMFFHTGLLMQVKNPAELVGVIAHESGHIASGHLARQRIEADNLTAQAWLGQILGLAVAIGAKSGDAAMAAASASQSLALRSMLRHSRIQEGAADQSGVRFLQDAGLPVDGFMTFMEQLASQELLPESQQSEYVRTHPISQDRVDFLRNIVETSPRIGQTPAGWDAKLKRMQAKLEAYLIPDRALMKRGSDTTSRYAQTIAHYRKGDFPKALSLVETIISDEPDNPYFYEIKGQMLFESGKGAQALAPYAKAAELAPKAGLIAGAYGHALLEAGKLDDAVRQLQRALQLEPKQSSTHQFLAMAYGRQGNEGLSRLHLAERSLLQGKFKAARTEANLALNALPKSGASRQRALDILDAAAVGEEKMRKKD